MSKKIRIAVLPCIIIMTMLLATVLTGCSGGKHNKKLVGTWYMLDDIGDETGEKYTFLRDGTGSVSEEGISGELKWETKGSQLTLTVSVCGMTDTLIVDFNFPTNNKNYMRWVEHDGGNISFLIRK